LVNEIAIEERLDIESKGRRTKRDDLSYADLHVRVACSHLVDKRVEGCEDTVWGKTVVPDLP
jgi:hypothetical protein